MIYTVSQKKQATIILSITLPHVDRFSIFFTDRFIRKYATKSSLTITPHLNTSLHYLVKHQYPKTNENLKHASFINNKSQCSVTTCLRCGEIVSQGFVANLLVNLPVKEVWKPVNIWRSYGQYRSALFFWLTVYIYYSIYSQLTNQIYYFTRFTEKTHLLYVLPE